MNAVKVMIVEDNTTVAEDCRECLESLGYTVTSIVASGKESIQRAEAELPDIVLMDIHLRDEIDGIKAGNEIYTSFAIPIVFLSAYGDKELLDRAKQVGSFGYLIKPFEEQELFTTLEMALYKAKSEKKQKQMDTQIQLLQKMESIGTLAGGIAHDFNNLLYTIMGNIDLAKDNMTDDTLTQDILIEAEKACLQATKLTQKLIAFSKGGSSFKEKTSIGKLLREIVTSTFEGSNIQFEFSISNDVKPITVDILQIKQVASNIAVNAKEAMQNEGILKVSCENVVITKKDNLTLDQGEYIKLSFKDQGRGISKIDLAKVFDPYFSTKDKSSNKGEGLGLALCHSIISNHKGLITVKSEPGIGSMFVIYLPYSTSKDSDLKIKKRESLSKTPEQQAETGKGKILLMDDEKSIRILLSRVIKKLGYDIETCTEGKEAIEIYQNATKSNKPFDVAILDLTNKYGMGGQETMKKLLEIDCNTKGIVITGYSDEPVVNNFRAYGFSGFLSKPTTMNELSKVINDVILKNQ